MQPTYHLDGFDNPTGAFLTIWWIEMLFGAIYVIGAGCMLLYTVRSNKRLSIPLYSLLLLVARFAFRRKGIWLRNVLLAMAGGHSAATPEEFEKLIVTR